MKALPSVPALVFVLAVAFPLFCNAQTPSESAFKIGPRITLSLGDISDAFGGDAAVGADVRYQFADFPIQGNGAFDFYFADEDVTVFTVDVNTFYVFDVGETLIPYAGAGLGFSNISFDVDTGFGSFSEDTTEIGLNLVGGTELMTGGSFTPFAQAQVTVGDLSRFGLTGGLLFAL
ncbi:outer membrane protein [Salinibacter ruber]|uniref:outer membrane protein n=1 Tax=Salinibacter ruber TaxID=146919 RepID=UPI000E6D05D0|nr:outer membrane beta-barrel protein [Salinibacter ruber]